MVNNRDNKSSEKSQPLIKSVLPCQKPKKKKTAFRIAYTNLKNVKLRSVTKGNSLSTEYWSDLNFEQRKSLTAWGLPSSIVSKYHEKNINSLFDWQASFLSDDNLWAGQNLVFSAPTSSGKTLIAEILMVKRVLELGKKAIMILPFISVAAEKTKNLQSLFESSGIRVEGFMGSINPPGGFEATDIAICTIEKANSLINRLLEENSLSLVGTVVVDELHLIGDQNRGYLLELLLTKIKFMLDKSNSCNQASVEKSQIDNKKKLNIQIIGMSATLPNLDSLGKWLGACIKTTEFRPVPLTEMIQIDNMICDSTLKPLRPVRLENLQIHPSILPNGVDDITYLSLETVLDGCSILIFCPSKQSCEKLALTIAKTFWLLGKPKYDSVSKIGSLLRSQLDPNKIHQILQQLEESPTGLDQTLRDVVSYGISFHHAGLILEEREIIETAFRKGVIRVIIATTTLSAGVNLPADRVLISTPTFFGRPLEAITYHQMIGRAGRQGMNRNNRGESILMCSKENVNIGKKLVNSKLPPIRSALLSDQGVTESMKRALLEAVAAKVSKSTNQLHKYYTQSTFLSQSSSSVNSETSPQDSSVLSCLDFLVENEFLNKQSINIHSNDPKSHLNETCFATETEEYAPTQLGSACLASSLSPKEGILVLKELQKARKQFVLETDLHIVYQVTPIYLADQWKNTQWRIFDDIFHNLSVPERKVAELVGVKESFIQRVQIYGLSRNDENSDALLTHRRFFTALALNDLVKEVPIHKVAEKYAKDKGAIQSLQQQASVFAGMVTAFCNRLGWKNMELLVSQFQERLQFGIQRELINLVRLNNINGQLARVLYNAKIKTIEDLAAAEPVHIQKIFHKAGPFSSAVHDEDSEGIRKIWWMGDADNEELTEDEYAKKIVQKARRFLLNQSLDLLAPIHIV